MTAARGRRAGFTLLELIVVLAVLGAMAGVVSLALRSPHDSRRASDAWHNTVAQARARALATGRPVHVPAHVAAGDADTSGSVREFVAYPDGSVLASAAAMVDTAGRAGPVDRLTGRVAPAAARGGPDHAP